MIFQCQRHFFWLKRHQKWRIEYPKSGFRVLKIEPGFSSISSFSFNICLKNHFFLMITGLPDNQIISGIRSVTREVELGVLKFKLKKKMQVLLLNSFPFFNFYISSIVILYFISQNVSSRNRLRFFIISFTRTVKSDLKKIT